MRSSDSTQLLTPIITLLLCIFCFLPSIVVHALSSSSAGCGSSGIAVETRLSTLLPWPSLDRQHEIDGSETCLGWTLERRDHQSRTHQVTLGWGAYNCCSDNDDPSGGEDSSSSVTGKGTTTTVDIPYFATNEQDSLACSMWPSGLAAAILLQSPSITSFLATASDTKKKKHVLELGSGLGLPGLTLAAKNDCCRVTMTDSDERVIQELRKIIKDNHNESAIAKVLEWRDNHSDLFNLDDKDGVDGNGCDDSDLKADVVVGADVAYYYFLLRPLMDTVNAFLKMTGSVLLICGQANRDSHWNLYDNIRKGCYNQLTDEHERPWPGSTQMLLYQLRMHQWKNVGGGGDEIGKPNENVVDGDVPIGILLHQPPNDSEGDVTGDDDRLLPFLTDFDYVATLKDQDQMLMGF